MTRPRTGSPVEADRVQGSTQHGISGVPGPAGRVHAGWCNGLSSITELAGAEGEHTSVAPAKYVDGPLLNDTRPDDVAVVERRWSRCWSQGLPSGGPFWCATTA